MSKLTGFPGSEVEPNWQAAAEQIALLKALEDNTPTQVVVQLGAAKYDVIFVAENPTSPALFDGSDGEPKFCAVHHDDQYWVWIVGTYTARQWISNCTGVIAQSNFPATTTPFQGAWLGMAQTIKRKLDLGIGDALNTPINIAGHSLGGAVAYALALLLRTSNPFRPVRLMTFGSPRPSRGTVTTVNPSFHYDVQTLTDNAVYLPPNLPLAPGAKWTLSGNVSVVKENGTLAPADSNDGELVINKVPEWGVYPHQLYAYVKFLLNRYQHDFPSGPSDGLLIATDQLSGKPIPPELKGPPAFGVPEFAGSPSLQSPLVANVTCR